jgi:hypothetical protein
VVRASGLVRVNSIPDRVQIARGNGGVDESVASAILEITFIKPEPEKIVGVANIRSASTGSPNSEPVIQQL